MNTFFGEIVEPHTRALIIDEYDIPENPEVDINSKYQIALPENISKLLFIETNNDKVSNQYGMSECYKPICKIADAGIDIHCENCNYVIIWSQKKEITSGEIVQLFEEWISLANQVYAISTCSIGIYQNFEMDEKPASLVRILTNTEEPLPYQKLEQPNLVTGLGANILSFCIHYKMKCVLFIIYTDLLPSDSLNSKPFSDILNHINFPVVNLQKIKPIISYGYDPSSLPPTKRELLQQIKRTQYISSIWCNAHMRSPTEKSPEDYGWSLIEGKYEYYWFDGPQSPSFEELSSSEFQDSNNSDYEEDSCQDDEETSSDEDEWSSDESDA